MIGSSNDETNFPQNLLLTNKQVSKICKAFANGSSINIKLSKTQLPKMIPSGGLELLPADLFFLFKMIPKAIKKLEDFSKNKNEIIE